MTRGHLWGVGGLSWSPPRAVNPRMGLGPPCPSQGQSLSLQSEGTAQVVSPPWVTRECPQTHSWVLPPLPGLPGGDMSVSPPGGHSRRDPSSGTGGGGTAGAGPRCPHGLSCGKGQVQVALGDKLSQRELFLIFIFIFFLESPVWRVASGEWPRCVAGQAGGSRWPVPCPAVTQGHPGGGLWVSGCALRRGNSRHSHPAVCPLLLPKAGQGTAVSPHCWHPHSQREKTLHGTLGCCG